MQRHNLILALAIVPLPSSMLGDARDAVAAAERGDYQTAFKEYSALAEKGDAKATVSIGLMYYQGQGFKQDYAKAMDWYLKAFKKGNGDAYCNIGVMYRDGLGVQTNRQIAYALFYLVYMRGLGSDDTQIRNGRNLDKTAVLMKREEISGVMKMTEKYVTAFVEKRGKLDQRDEALKFSKGVAPLSSYAAALGGGQNVAAHPKGSVVNVSLLNASTNALDWVQLKWQGPDVPGGILSPGISATALGVEWPNSPSAKLSFVDDKTRKRYNIAVPLTTANGQISAGGIQHVIFRILAYDKAVVVCE